MGTNTFDFSDLVDSPELPANAISDTTPWEAEAEPLKQWAGGVVDQAVAGTSGAPVIFDIETGARSEDELRSIYRERTLDEFAADCDKRWKPETVAAKYEAYKVTAWDEFVTRAALSPVTGRVLLIGFIVTPGSPMFTYNDDEAKMLNRWWTLVEDWLAAKTPLIGHNSNSFDLPFLIRRSWALGVPVPREVRQGRYWNPLFRDTMEWWACGSRDTVKLNTLGEFFGVGQKTEGVSGKDFSRLWYGQMPAEVWGTPEQQRLKALEYNGTDLKLTAAIAAKMGML